MIPRLLPDDINVEELLLYLPRNYHLAVSGPHGRNCHRDIVEFAEELQGKAVLKLGRKGLYDSLPEYLFHPVNRFDNFPANERDERFADECQKQEDEISDARGFFLPLDMLLLDLRVKIRKSLDGYVSGSNLLVEFLGDDLSEKQKQNRFIRKALMFLPASRHIRGNKSLLTLMLRKIFLDEGIRIREQSIATQYADAQPRYNETEGGPLSSLYLGNTYEENVVTYMVHYWPDDECNDEFLTLVEEIEEFGGFVQDYFISVENVLRFDISCKAAPLRLSDTESYNFLNYNTNL